ncbi:hypothetical protein BGZ96_007498 [Linnemannia gamsii]|uniref:FAD-binding domain-containing protein n=1 Tax=Linnemannia gamsii TaxID=64522 RepID=A0ABQ7K1P4_9FUNG|nr:hypothetical protein BGZ96_007498 [Linnemannia gamsii]
MSTSDKPTVLIVGAGLGGLLLGALLEKSGVPYTIFERAATVKPLGSALAVGPTLLPIFQQIGIYDEIVAAGKIMTHTRAYNESLRSLSTTDYGPIVDYTGYGNYIIPRPAFYDIMLRQVPAHKIHFGHRVLNISEEDGKVTAHLSNNGMYEGDIIVGADGAYSAVRQRMYEQLRAKGELPKSDQEELPFSCTCLVGQTKVVDPEEFPIIKEAICQFRAVLGAERPYTWGFMTTANGTLTWSVMHHLSKTMTRTALEQRFRNNDNSEWSNHTAAAMCDETRDFPIQLDDGKKRTMGDLYDLTPKDLISKVMLEEKVFTTWYYGRYVLMGDACHKLSPSGGHGAVTAMHDAIALANLIYAMPTWRSEDITTIFKEYQEERYPAVMESFKNSQLMSKRLDKGIVGALVLFLITHMPTWLWRIMLAKTVRHRPQVGFLPSIPFKGTVVPTVSPSEQKARTLFDTKQQEQQQIVQAV